MSRPEPSIRQRLPGRPSLSLSRIRQVRPKDILIRFVAGAATSVVAGIITLVFGPKAGGIFLAFPAILVASLTLIVEEEDAQDAREDSRGAVLGGAAMSAFAAVGTATLSSLPAGLALVLATAAWAVVAVGGYFLIWWRRRESGGE